MDGPVTLDGIDAQEQRLADAFRRGDIRLAADLYHPQVVYMSPTTRLYGWESPVVGIEPTMEFIALTIADCRNIDYRLDERAVLPDGHSAYTRIVFDFDTGEVRLRSEYVVVYRYRDGLIGRQELYYDPSGELARIS
ncbi:MAG: nuclear transport factor 2 family protein [Acidimicrobiales bacterium]